MCKDDKLTDMQRDKSFEILTFMITSSNEEYKAYAGMIPMTERLYSQIVAKFKRYDCVQLMKSFIEEHGSDRKTAD